MSENWNDSYRTFRYDSLNYPWRIKDDMKNIKVANIQRLAFSRHFSKIHIQTFWYFLPYFFMCRNLLRFERRWLSTICFSKQFFILYHTSRRLYSHPFTQSRQLGYMLLSFSLLAFSISIECQILKALFLYYAYQNFQLPLSYSNCPFCSCYS